MIKISNPSTMADYADNGAHVMLHIDGLTVHRENDGLFLLHGIQYADLDLDAIRDAFRLNPRSAEDQNLLEQLTETYHRVTLARELAKRIKLA